MKKLDIDRIEERKEIDETHYLFYDINWDKIKRNKKENHKSFWKRFNEKWIWVSIGFCICNTFMLWLLFFLMIIDLILALFFTVLFPLMIILVYYGRKSIHQRTISKILTQYK